MSNLRLYSIGAVVGWALVVGCADQKITGFSSADNEFNDNAPFQRGTKRIGEACTQRTECASLLCQWNICTQPCSAAACPRGALCADAIEVINSQCTASADCASQSACANSSCTCSAQGVCFVNVEAYCLELCPSDSCTAPDAFCSRDVTGVKVCAVTAAFNEDDPNMPPPPPPGAKVGDPCPQGTECDSAGLLCDVENFAEPVCSQDCLNTNCPQGALCLMLDVDLSRCSDECADDNVCAAPSLSCGAYDSTMACY